MLLREFFTDTNENVTWAKSGNQAVRKYRCSSGPRKGRVVSRLSQCYAPMDLKKRMNLKKTKAKYGSRLAKKSKKTKKINPVSRRVSRLNRK